MSTMAKTTQPRRRRLEFDDEFKMAAVRLVGCLRCLLLVMYTHPFSKEALTLHLARSEGHERYFGCNLMHCRVLVSSHQHLMAEAPVESPAMGKVSAIPKVGGLHHHYTRRAA